MTSVMRRMCAGGVLQKLLGDGFEVINEGLNGRTTCIDDQKPGREDKNGLTIWCPAWNP